MKLSRKHLWTLGIFIVASGLVVAFQNATPLVDSDPSPRAWQAYCRQTKVMLTSSVCMMQFAMVNALCLRQQTNPACNSDFLTRPIEIEIDGLTLPYTLSTTCEALLFNCNKVDVSAFRLLAGPPANEETSCDDGRWKKSACQANCAHECVRRDGCGKKWFCE